jgi:hypothetical protein
LGVGKNSGVHGFALSIGRVRLTKKATAKIIMAPPPSNPDAFIQSLPSTVLRYAIQIGKYQAGMHCAP